MVEAVQAICHCGAVAIEVDAPPAKLTECNCSICGRRGVLWAKYPAAAVRFLRGHDATTPYVWGDRLIEFHHCKVCGCTTHYRGIVPEHADSIGINARLMTLDPNKPVPVTRLDGASSWEVVGDGGHWPWAGPRSAW
jgi:hypothetical protein